VGVERLNSAAEDLLRKAGCLGGGLGEAMAGLGLFRSRRGLKLREGARWVAALLAAFQLAGCYTDYGPVTNDSVPLTSYSVTSRLQPGDQLKIIVFGEDSLSGIYEVSPAGAITMPLVGTVAAAGRTAAEVERALTRAYVAGKFLQEPKISVSVVSYRPFYIFGEVLTPGRYPYIAGLNVLTAVATAGGFTYRASRTSALVRHPGEDVWQEYSLAAPILVQPGDLIRIPERYF
jgi:polysaccharide export outer membrane protein